MLYQLLSVAASLAINYQYGRRIILWMADTATRENPHEALTWTPAQIGKLAVCFALGFLWGAATVLGPLHVLQLFGLLACATALPAYYIARELTDFIPSHAFRKLDAQGWPATFTTCMAIYGACFALLWALLDFAFTSWANVGLIIAAWVAAIGGFSLPNELGVFGWTRRQLDARGLGRFRLAAVGAIYTVSTVTVRRFIIWWGARALTDPATALLEVVCVVAAVAGWSRAVRPAVVRPGWRMVLFHLATAQLLKTAVLVTVWYPQTVTLWIALAYTAVFAPRCTELRSHQVPRGIRVATYAITALVLFLFTTLVWQLPHLAQAVLILYPMLFIAPPAPIPQAPTEDELRKHYEHHDGWFMTSCNPLTRCSLQNEVLVPAGHVETWHRYAAAYYRTVLGIPSRDHIYPDEAARRRQRLMREIRMAPENVDLRIIPHYERIRYMGFRAALTADEAVCICPPRMWAHFVYAGVVSQLRYNASFEQKNEVLEYSPQHSPRRNAIAEAVAIEEAQAAGHQRQSMLVQPMCSPPAPAPETMNTDRSGNIDLTNCQIIFAQPSI